MLVTVDIGGTNTRIAQIAENNNFPEIIRIEKYLTKDIATQQGLLEALDDFSQKKITRLSLGVAGPILDDTVSLTNFPLKIIKKEIEDYYHNQIQVSLINDLEATAYSLFVMSEEKTRQLYGKKKSLNLRENIALMTPGTGLGEAYILKETVFSSEGGHCAFAPTDNEETALLSYYLNKGEELSYESLLSGKGFVNIYKYLWHKKYKESYKGNITSMEITKKALENSHREAIEWQTLSLYLKILGQEGKNLILKAKALGGLVLTGNILNYLEPIIEETGYLQEAFKTDFLLKDTPIYLLKEPEPQLYGLWYYDKLHIK